jgi:hypothetical protein
LIPLDKSVNKALAFTYLESLASKNALITPANLSVKSVVQQESTLEKFGHKSNLVEDGVANGSNYKTYLISAAESPKFSAYLSTKELSFGTMGLL